ncbi:MAG: LysM peptidoglycan-binding domain-containing protein, partial [Calditrichaeota bacterium]
MKHTAWLAAILAVLIGSWGCQRHTATHSPKISVLQQQLDRVAFYLESAQNAAEEDTPGPGFYYQQAMQLLDSLNLRYGEDPAYRQMRLQVEAAYQEYQARQQLEIMDTLAAAQVLEDLGRIFESDDSAEGDLLLGVDAGHVIKIPVEMNHKVRKAIHYFANTRRGRRIFRKWLQRAGKYEKVVKQILREEGAPEDLFYLAMIESGLNPRARSYARAVGMWQFISSTGRAYGLHHSWWYDERRDVIKATRAAARHLMDLYERFGDWYLAIAGYNYNPNKIERKLARYNADGFWDLPRLPRQTRNYVPTFLAAMVIAGDPEKYGFTDFYREEPLEFDTVTVRECVDLNVVAECVGSTFREIKELNPALLRWCTPPDRDSWLLYLPKGTRETFLERYAKIPEDQKVTWIRHRIRSGETLSTIARKYRVSVSEIRRFNKIRGSLIRAGASLIIPVPKNQASYRRYLAAHSRSSRSYRRPKPVENVPGREKHVYTVKSGDSLWKIAQTFGVTMSEIRRWNGLSRYSRIIKPGQTLNIWLPP